MASTQANYTGQINRAIAQASQAVGPISPCSWIPADLPKLHNFHVCKFRDRLRLGYGSDHPFYKTMEAYANQLEKQSRGILREQDGTGRPSQSYHDWQSDMWNFGHTVLLTEAGVPTEMAAAL